MIDAVLSVFNSVSPASVVWIVSGGIVVLFFCGLFGIISRQAVPALMTSLGILGTFWGIFIALHPLKDGGFAPEKINDSIQSLLEGMTTAFVTSLLGLAAAIIFRFSWLFIARIVLSLSRIFGKNPPSTPEHKDMIERLDAIKQAISGGDDSSMVSQMKQLRVDTQDGFKKLDGLADTIRDALVKNIEGLMKDLREIIGEQLGEQLKKLIANIEEALINQFGKTFVEFNEAVQALKKWQEDHRVQVEQLTAAFAQTAQGIDKIRADCESIPATMEKLRVILESATAQIEDLTARLNAFADMKKQAEESFPAIKANLDKIGSDLAESAKGFEGMEKAINDAFVASVSATENIVKSHTANVDQIVANMRDKMEQAQRDTANKIDGVIQNAVEKFTQEMNREVDRVARAWGGNLTSIAEKCAEAIRKVEERRGE